MNQEACSIVRLAKALGGSVLAVSLFALQALAQSPDTVTVTIYRASGGLIGSTAFGCDHSKYKIVVYRDGQKVLRIEKGRFVKLRLPVGRHAFKSTRSRTLEIDFKPGGQYFIRPRQMCGGGLLAREAIEVVACQEASTEGRQLGPLDSKDIYVEKSQIEDTAHFSEICKARPVF